MSGKTKNVFCREVYGMNIARSDSAVWSARVLSGGVTIR